MPLTRSPLPRSDGVGSTASASASAVVRRSVVDAARAKCVRSAACSLCHITYSRDLAPFRMSLLPCRMCGRRLVPDMLLTTLEAPDSAPILGVGQLLEVKTRAGVLLLTITFSLLLLRQARVCRRKKRAQGEVNARLVSELIPFIEFDIHRQLLYKMRILGMNAAFALHMHITVGEDLIVALASVHTIRTLNHNPLKANVVLQATAASLAALPTPPPLRISRNIGVEDAEDRELLEMQRRIVELSNENCKRMVGSECCIGVLAGACHDAVDGRRSWRPTTKEGSPVAPRSLQCEARSCLRRIPHTFLQSLLQRILQ